jgi:aquaporin NIP
MRRKLFAEALGTFCLVFAGTGAIVVNDVSGGAVSQVGIALTFGLIVMAVIYTVGDVSGAHINPAVSVGFFAAGRLDATSLLPYIASQIGGALAASGLLRILFPLHRTLGATLPAGSIVQSFVLEIVLTAILMWVILSVSHGAKERGITAGLAIGSVVGLEALFAGPISGASMNPARSLAPAVVALEWTALWLYVAAPVCGALIGVVACRMIRAEGCCATIPDPCATETSA